jgi:lipid A ethanolaminephosphotransferase
MALRLFRTTGYSTLLMPGEARLAPHPAKAGLWASLWLALACNVAVWRVLGGALELARPALASAAIIAGASGIVFSVLGWRRTLKPAITVALIAAALLACGLWTQQLPIDALWRRPPRSLLPSWADFMRWQVLVLVLVLAVVPIVSLWNTSLRRLPGPAQLRANILGVVLFAAVLAGGIALA